MFCASFRLPAAIAFGNTKRAASTSPAASDDAGVDVDAEAAAAAGPKKHRAE